MGSDRPLTETVLKAARDSRRGDAGADDSDVGAAFSRFTPRPPDFPGGGIDGPFDGSFLTAPIGPGEANRPHDVRHASRMLAANGRLARETDAFDRDMEQAIVGLQKDLGVKQDARAKPNGPTETLVQRGFADGRLTLPPTETTAPGRQNCRGRARSTPRN